MPSIPFSKRFRQRHPGSTRGLLLITCFGAAFVLGFAYASWAMVCRAGRCPSAAALDSYEPRQTSKLYAADGRFIAELGLERRTIVKFDDIPPLVRQAFVVTEDRRFYQHAGIDWWRVPGAVAVDIRNRSWAEGFSTITMQLARNIFPERISRDKSVVRKLKEAKVARAIERRYDKNRILELYLNQIYLGSGAYGIEAASERYFGKTLKQLDVAETATLAALPKGPERYNPRKFPERAVQRRNLVIGLLRDANLIDSASAAKAQASPLRLAERADAEQTAPYFVDWIRQQLDDRFGRRLYEQGLKVYTTLDLDLQKTAERSLERQIRDVEAGKYGVFPHTTYSRYMRSSANGDDQENVNTPYLQGAFIAMDPHTGAIRALIGGRDFDDSKFDRAVQAVRQPGSTFKPIVYADAVQNGRPLSYILDDSPLTVDMGPGADPWTPQNFEGDFTGKIPMRRALYQSRNVPTIRLGMELGTASVIDEARKFGLSTPIPGYPSIFIGSAEVIPIELVAAYSAFATLGTRAQPMAITRVENQHGDVIWSQEPTTVPVMTQEEAWLMVSVMKDVVQRGTAAGSVGAEFHHPAGGKTGTTNDGTDVWFVGYTSDLVAGVWMGFDKPQKIKANAQGGILAAPVWTSFMNDVYRHKPPPSDWPMPPDIVTRQIDVTTNMLATPYCPRSSVGSEFFISGTDPVSLCNVHTAYGMYQDTSGLGGYPPYGVPPGSTYALPPGYDTSRASPVAGRAGRLLDSLRRFLDSVRTRRDSLIYEPGDTTSRYRPTVPPRDTMSRYQPGLPPDALRRIDSLRRRRLDSLRMIRPLDTSRIRPPDTSRIRPDTPRVRPDTSRIRPDTSRL